MTWVGARRTLGALILGLALLSTAAGRGDVGLLLSLAGLPLLLWRHRTPVQPMTDEYRGMGRGRPTPNDPDEAEALRVLGLQAGATEAQITVAHRNHMRIAHPDRGGSAAAAARANWAREVLRQNRRVT